MGNSVISRRLLAPTINIKTWEERKADAKTMADYLQAKTAVEGGEGTGKVFGIQSAVLMYDSLRPEAISHPERMAQFNLPGLAIYGSTDGLFASPLVLERMRKAYCGKFDVLRYEKGTHGLRESKDRLPKDIDAWIKKTFPLEN